MKSLALEGISIYQRFISPRKGFVCAHRVLHGGISCSAFAAEAIRDHGVIAGIRNLRERFEMCRQAYLILNAEEKDKTGNEVAKTCADPVANVCTMPCW
ncbi:membrane protein insertion efficiency factor YidD [Azonexus sp.]|jgi:putative component of membrane protein insertase Oxa1/YidC/SpoIIIJ protein YidD|uniref:membrane protein insertion efficiency factor YidD n=1 Tax=Azonexus sp. TaxID=1872668 RepID=UPI0028341FF5|nr:membrane protein insertion efficiency factor YidD [Azonexus sp.]